MSKFFTFELKNSSKDLIDIDEENGLYQACFVSKNKLNLFFNLEYKENAGIYFLLKARKIVYVGLANNLFKRLKQHNEAFWDEVIVISSKIESRLFDVRNDRIKYLEKKFIELIGKENLTNRTVGDVNISSSDKAMVNMLNKYVDFALEVFNILNISNIGENNKNKRKTNVKTSSRDNNKLINKEFYFVVKKHNIKNTIICENLDRWILKSGAKLKPNSAEGSAFKTIERLRREHSNFIENYITTKDLAFKSANLLGEFVCGQAINVWNSFVTKDGFSMDDIARS